MLYLAKCAHVRILFPFTAPAPPTCFLRGGRRILGTILGGRERQHLIKKGGGREEEAGTRAGDWNWGWDWDWDWDWRLELPLGG